jgi:PAS domain S-box-containing protein
MTQILIADDNGANRYFLEALLNNSGYQTVSAENGKQALELACLAPPDLIITDILMPVMDGFDLCRIWKTDSRLRKIPFIFYTATYTEPKDERLAMSLGADRFVIKPQEPEDLLALIREVLSGASSSPEPGMEKTLDSEMEYLRQHNESLFNKLQKKMRDLQVNQLLTQNLMENSPALIYIVDRGGRFLHVNRQMERSMKRSAAELIGKTREHFIPADIAAQFLANDQQVFATGLPLTFEELGREPDGDHIYFTVKFPLRDENGQYYAICGISTDITKRRKLEIDFQKLAGLHAMLYQVNRAIRSTKEEKDLFEATCHLCIDYGKFDLAWIGWVLTEGGMIRPDFAAGPLKDFMLGRELTLNEILQETDGSRALGLGENQVVVNEDWATDHGLTTWRAKAAQHGIHSSAALPINLEGHTLAILNLYSVHQDFFSEDRLALLQELAQDLSHAIQGMIEARHREKAEKALIAREMEFRAAFEQGAVGMAQVSQEGYLLNVNRQLCILLGYSREELTGRNVSELTHPDDQGMTIDLLQSLKAGLQEHYQLQKRYLRKDGQAIWVDLSGSVVQDPEGRVLYYLSAFKDVTKQVEALYQAQEEKLKLQALINSIPDLVWLKDMDGVYLYCNLRFEEFFGASISDIAGKTDYDFVARELADFFRQRDQMAIEKGIPSINEEWVTFASDGHRELLETIKTPFHDASGCVRGVLGIGRNITHIRNDQERLRKLSKAIEQSPVGVMITDREGHIEYINPCFTETTGYRLSEILGQTPRILKSETTPLETYTKLWNTILAGGVWRGELQNRRKNGELYWETAAISPITDESGAISHFVALQEDITEQIRLNEQLKESEDQYSSLFRNMLNGFALCRIIRDEQDHPVDFEYLAVNHAFESLTGMKDVVGKRVSEAIPGIREANPEVIELYGRVARTGQPESFEAFVKPLGMWFSISAYSPKPEYFVAVFDVITERKRSEQAIKAQLDELQRWHEITLGRENRVLDLKREVNALLAKLGQPARYGSVDAGEAPSGGNA